MQLPIQPYPWQRYPVVQLLAVIIGCGPVYGLAIWSGFSAIGETSMPVPGVIESVLNAVITVAAFGGLILVTMIFLNGEPPSRLTFKQGTVWTDILQGILLSAILIGVQMGMGILYYLFSGTTITPPDYNAQLGKELAANPWLMGVWLTVVAWLQAGLLEEFTRTFLLSRLWRVWPSPTSKWLVVVGSSLVFGMGHMYQGPLGIIGTSVIGYIFGMHYLKNGRLWPLIIGHSLYNSCVMILLAMPSFID